MPTCPICGTDGAACLGHAGSQVVQSIDTLVAIKETRTVGDLKRYKDKAGHVFSLTAERADMLGYTLVEEPKPEAKQVSAPAANKAVTRAPATKGR